MLLERVPLGDEQLQAVPVDPFEMQALGAQQVRQRGSDRPQRGALIGGVGRREPGQPVGLLHRLDLLPLLVERREPQQGGTHFIANGTDQSLGRRVELGGLARDGDQTVEPVLAGRRLD